jgi:hypothetical protein
MAVFAVVAGVILTIWLAAPVRLILDLIGAVAFGWLMYPRRVLPNVRLDPEGVATMVVCLALFTFGLHRMLRWLYSECHHQGDAGSESGRRWLLRWTLSLVTLIFLMFVVGIAATGIVHQGGWLVASRRSLIELKPRSHDRWGTSQDHLRQFGLGVYVFHEGRTRPEIGGSGKTYPTSWMARMLPDLGLYPSGFVRREFPWNSPENSANYKGIVPVFLNPEVRPTRTPEGYGLGHYAGNVHAPGTPEALRGAAVPNSSQLIAAGEVAEGFKAWGDPTNLRDPGLGVNKAPGGFGGPSGAGAYFLFMDGSVRYLMETTDVEILRRLSGPQRVRRTPGERPSPP